MAELAAGGDDDPGLEPAAVADPGLAAKINRCLQNRAGADDRPFLQHTKRPDGGIGGHLCAGGHPGGRMHPRGRPGPEGLLNPGAHPGQGHGGVLHKEQELVLPGLAGIVQRDQHHRRRRGGHVLLVFAIAEKGEVAGPGLGERSDIPDQLSGCALRASGHDHGADFIRAIGDLHGHKKALFGGTGLGKISYGFLASAGFVTLGTLNCTGALVAGVVAVAGAVAAGAAAAGAGAGRSLFTSLRTSSVMS